ncbi:MAG: hypothetical protein H0V96_10995 [Acidimicrobiia bacterium]|nr:hypothetical protein [Acidimicrobiia bacterium]
MRKFLVALIAVGVIAAGGAIYAANRDSSATPAPTTSGDNDTGAEASDGSARDSQSRGGSSLVAEVLDGLVADDTITEAQAVAIEAALEARRQEARDRIEAGREGQAGDRNGGAGGQEELLDDGVIDADELAALPDDHLLNDPNGPAAAYLDDGQLTQDELDQIDTESFPATPGGGHGEDHESSSDTDTPS